MNNNNNNNNNNNTFIIIIIHTPVELYNSWGSLYIMIGKPSGE